MLLECTGKHDHARPPIARASPKAKLLFEETVLRAPGVLPKPLLVGVSGAKPISEIHDAFHNLDHTAYARRRVLKKIKIPNTLDGLASWQAASPEHAAFIVRNSLVAGEGFYELSQPWMEAALSGWDAPLSTDAVEGFISTPPNASLLCTVGFLESVDRVVPLKITIILGKTASHYEKHFDALFHSMKLAVSVHGPTSWPGMAVDFSSAQLKAFHTSLARYMTQEQKSLTPEEAAKLTDSFVVVRAMARRDAVLCTIHADSCIFAGLPSALQAASAASGQAGQRRAAI